MTGEIHIVIRDHGQDKWSTLNRFSSENAAVSGSRDHERNYRALWRAAQAMAHSWRQYFTNSDVRVIDTAISDPRVAPVELREAA